MQNIGCWSDRSKVASIPRNRSVSPYKVVRVSHTPLRQYHSPSPVRALVAHPQLHKPQVIQKPMQLYGHSSPIHKPPSQVYYVSGGSVIGGMTQKQKGKEEPCEQYNVWEGYESKTDLFENTSRILTERNKTVARDNPGAPKNFKKPQNPPHNCYYAVANTEGYGARSQIQYSQMKSVSPIKARNEYQLLQHFR